MAKGISVIICCYNSEKRLGATLKALSEQQFSRNVPWEILIIDNASTDQTAAKAVDIWTGYSSEITMKVIAEVKPGLSRARKTGIQNARYDYLLFCDDDNWLSADYLEKGFDILEKNTQVAALGGTGVPVFETKKPAWFDSFSEAYAVGSQSLTIENNKQLSLYGAGMFIRKSCYLKIVEYGFRELLNDRTGSSLSSSGDTELTNAFSIAGFQLMSLEQMTFKHFLTANRLDKKYLERLFIAFGSDGPLRNIYYSFQTDKIVFLFFRFWIFHFAVSIVRLVKYLLKPPKKNSRYIYFVWNLSYIKGLFKLSASYSTIIMSLKRFETQALMSKHFTEVPNHSLSLGISQNNPVLP